MYPGSAELPLSLQTRGRLGVTANARQLSTPLLNTTRVVFLGEVGRRLIVPPVSFMTFTVQLSFGGLNATITTALPLSTTSVPFVSGMTTHRQLAAKLN